MRMLKSGLVFVTVVVEATARSLPGDATESRLLDGPLTEAFPIDVIGCLLAALQNQHQNIRFSSENVTRGDDEHDSNLTLLKCFSKRLMIDLAFHQPPNPMSQSVRLER